MAILSRQPLSGSTSGQGITIHSSAPGVIIHAVSTATSIKDTVYLWAGNLSTTEARFIEVYFGATDSNSRIALSIPPSDGAYAVIPGWTLFGGTTTATGGGTVYAVGTATNNVKFFGYVDRAS